MADNSMLIANALEKTGPQLFNRVDGSRSWRYHLQKKGSSVAMYRRYEAGNHDSSLTEQMRKMLRIKSDTPLGEFSLNYCRIVIDKMVSRLRVAEIRTDVGDSSTFISDLLNFQDWESLQIALFRNATRDGECYVIPSPTTGKWELEPAYDGFGGMVAIRTRGSDFPVWACKVWSEAGLSTDPAGEDDDAKGIGKAIMHLTVYQPNSITHWVGEEGGSEVAPFKFSDSEATTTYGITSANKSAWMGKVPVVQFTNLTDNYSVEGESELRVVLPIQNVLNRTLHSLVMASEFGAFKVAYSIGMELDKSGITPGAILNLVITDDKGVPVTSLSESQIEFLKAVKVGELEATDLSQYINLVQDLTRHVSQVSQTPIYGVTFEGALSGDALRQLEIGLIGKVRRFQKENTAAVRALIELSVEIQNFFMTERGEAPGDMGNVTVVWDSPELTDVNASISTLIKLRKEAPGLFSDELLRSRIGSLLGMSQDDIAKETVNTANEAQSRLDRIVNQAGQGNTDLVQ